MGKEEIFEKIVEILNFIHQGGDFETAKAMFNETFEQVDESETRICPICGMNMVKNYSSIKKQIQIDDCYGCGGKFLDFNETLLKLMNDYFICFAVYKTF